MFSISYIFGYITAMCTASYGINTFGLHINQETANVDHNYLSYFRNIDIFSTFLQKEVDFIDNPVRKFLALLEYKS